MACSIRATFNIQLSRKFFGACTLAQAFYIDYLAIQYLCGTIKSQAYLIVRFFVLLLFIFAFRWNKLTNERQARNISIERTNLMTKHKLIVHQTEYLHFDSVHTASNRKTNHFNIALRWENENSPHSVFSLFVFRTFFFSLIMTFSLSINCSP